MLASRDIRLLALTKQLDTRDRSTLFHNFPQTTILSRQTHQQPPSHPAGFYQIQKLPFSFLQTRISENLVGNFGQAFTLWLLGLYIETKLPPVKILGMPCLIAFLSSP
jgi:hypothetical protein